MRAALAGSKPNLSASAGRLSKSETRLVDLGLAGWRDLTTSVTSGCATCILPPRAALRLLRTALEAKVATPTNHLNLTTRILAVVVAVLAVANTGCTDAASADGGATVDSVTADASNAGSTDSAATDTAVTDTASTDTAATDTASADTASADTASNAVVVTAADFDCMLDWQQVRRFRIKNIAGKQDAALAVANNSAGGVYPAGTFIQLIPTEAMVKREAGFSAGTGDWEFFSLKAQKSGTTIVERGTTTVKNGFGGNCFGCHAKAEAKWDLVCETGHGCDPLPFSAAVIKSIQDSDPRCP